MQCGNAENPLVGNLVAQMQIGQMHDNLQNRICAECETAYCTANRPTEVRRVAGIAGGSFCPMRFLTTTGADGTTQLDGDNELCLECF